MSKIVKAVTPFFFDGGINFKHKPYDAWVKLGGCTAKAHYPIRQLHRLAYSFDFPSFHQSKKEARIRFVQPYSVTFDTFPDYMWYEIIPVFWDVWPDVFEKTYHWIKKHNIKTAIFTSSQVANRMKELFPEMNILFVTEGIDIEPYKQGKLLKERTIDYLEYGREIDRIVKYNILDTVNYVSGKKNGKPIFSQDQLYNNLADAKIVAAYPKSWTNPEEAGGIETLTQRYWECMLSRCIMVGHAPQELRDLLGYNPVIEIDKDNPDEQLLYILSNIDNYQQIVENNFKSALTYGNWEFSMNRVQSFLYDCNYII